VDEWPVGDPLRIIQPRTTLERCGVAREFSREYEFCVPILVDAIENEFSEKFSAWPIRFFVLEEGRRLVFKAQPDHLNTYDSIPPALDGFLGKYLY